jgi:hypothetical protein
MVSGQSVHALWRCVPEFRDGLEDFVYRKRIMPATCGADLPLAMVGLNQMGEPCNGSQGSGTSLPEVNCGATCSGFESHMPCFAHHAIRAAGFARYMGLGKATRRILLGESVSWWPLSPRVPKCPLGWSRVSWACVSEGHESACTSANES